MTSEDWQRVRELFNGTYELTPEQRAQILDEVGKKQPHLRAEVESLLASHDAPDELFEPLDRNIIATATEQGESDDRAGTIVGAYRIVRRIAFGGMGEVYEAVRSDGQFEKRVAVKLVRLGLSQKEITRRFEAERRVLATLIHANIAQLIDAGTTDDYVPFLMMEFVEGKRIDEYCDEHKLSIEERLQLFCLVCSVVHFAHQNLVVHRDIKPGNILVMQDGTPKLLDFGIAKLLSEDAEGADSTRTGAGFMTPEYASPEQIRGLHLTTVSDVYSLGVLLYTLLTGQKPYEFKSSLPFEITRTVIDTEPSKPSTKDITIKLHDGNVNKVRRRLSGDIDAIVLKALRKEPYLRYQSAQEFADDINRYFDGRPVHARRDSRSYRLTKFVRRNRATVLAVSLIVLSLLAGLAATLYQEHVTRREKARAESINAFLIQILNYSNPVRHLPGKSGSETTMKEVLDEAAKRIASKEFDNQPDVRADLERILAESYSFQGRYDLMYQHMRSYIAIQQQLYGESDPKSLDALAMWADVLFGQGKMAESENIFRKTIPRMRNAFHDGTIKADVFANALNNFGYLRRTQGDSREAEATFREVLSLAPMLPSDSRFVVGLTRSTLASTLADQGKFDEAVQTAREAVTDCRQRGTTTTPDYGFVLTVLGGFLTEQGKFAEADSLLYEAEAMFRLLLTPAHLWLGDNLRNQAASLYQQGEYTKALAKAGEALRIYRESFGPHYDHYPTALTIQGLILNKQGKSIEAEKILREAVNLRVELLPKGHFFIALAQSALGECLTTQRRFAEAEPLLRETYKSLRTSQGEYNPRTVWARYRLAALYQAMEKQETR